MSLLPNVARNCRCRTHFIRRRRSKKRWRRCKIAAERAPNRSKTSTNMPDPVAGGAHPHSEVLTRTPPCRLQPLITFSSARADYVSRFPSYVFSDLVVSILHRSTRPLAWRVELWESKVGSAYGVSPANLCVLNFFRQRTNRRSGSSVKNRHFRSLKLPGTTGSSKTFATIFLKATHCFIAPSTLLTCILTATPSASWANSSRRSIFRRFCSFCVR